MTASLTLPFNAPSATSSAAPRPESFPLARGSAHILPAALISPHLLAQTRLAAHICDHRYYQIVHQTLAHEFALHYLVLHDPAGNFLGAQPFFIVQQNILAGMQGAIANFADSIRSRFPNFLTLKTLMLGNPAGPAVLGVKSSATPAERSSFSRALSEALSLYTRRHRVRIVVFKDFPASDRAAMLRLTDSSSAHAGGAPADFIRLPSMPMTALDLTPFKSFDDYLEKALSKSTRKNLRRKFKKTADEKVEFSVHTDIDPLADEIHRLYLQVYNRASLKFEKLTPDYFRQLARQMPDRARFFLWKRQGKILAASITLVQFPGIRKSEVRSQKSQDSALYDIYLGMEYPIALDLSLYHLTMRDVIQWCIENKIARYVSTPLNYDAKLHFRHRLVPQDLYARHTSPILNPAFQFAMRFAEPTRHDKTLPQFPNFPDLAAP